MGIGEIMSGVREDMGDVREQLAKRAEVPTEQVLGVVSYRGRSWNPVTTAGLPEVQTAIQAYLDQEDSRTSLGGSSRTVGYVGNFDSLQKAPERGDFHPASEYGLDREGVLLVGEDIL